jgi:hypothetical protein
VKVEGWSMEQVLQTITEDRPSIATDILYLVIKFSKENPKESGKSWPTLMKNDTFFEQVAAYIKGQHDASAHKEEANRP